MKTNNILIVGALVLGGAVGYKQYQKYKKKQDRVTMQVSMPLQQTITFVPQIEKNCVAGELDYIRDIHNISGELLLSIEPLPGSRSFKPITKRIQVIDLFNFERMKLDFSAIDPKYNYDMGVWICSDRKRTGKCGDKKSFDFEKAAKQIQDNGRIDVGNADNVYYFQYLNVRDRKAALLDIANLDEKDFPRYATAMIAAKGYTKTQIETLYKYIKSKVFYIGSRGVGVRESNGNFQILAHFTQLDKKKCSPQAYAEEFFKIVKPRPKGQNNEVKPTWRTLPKFSRQ